MPRDILLFNEGFPNPLPEKEIKSKFHSFLQLVREKHYRFKNSTIMDIFKLSDEDCRALNLTLHTDARTRKRDQQIKEGKTSKQKQEKRYKQVKQLYGQQHMKAAEIAQILHYSISTIEADITRYRKEVRGQTGTSKSLPDTAETSSTQAQAAGATTLPSKEPSCPSVITSASAKDLPYKEAV